MDIKGQIEALRQELNEHCHRYYILDRPCISDFEYDRLLRELEDLEKANPDLVQTDSPTLRVGGAALSKFDYIDNLCKCVLCLPEGTVLHRITGDAPKALLVEPKWSADKKRVLQEIKEAFSNQGIILE